MSFPTTLPASTAVPLTGGPTLRWGVLGPGAIAGDFTRSLHDHTDQRVVAVGSSSSDRADKFGAELGVERTYGRYDALLADPGVDIVYIATTNNFHHDHALLAIAAGKHVLIEKPIALDAGQARAIASAARAAGVFATEAMWSRFLPKSSVIRRLLDDGAIGDVVIATAELGFGFKRAPSSRMYDPALGGGALLDLAVYSIWWNQFVLGTPEHATATGTVGPTGVDHQAVITLRYPAAQGVAIATMDVTLDNRATAGGSEGRIIVPGFLAPGGFRLISSDGDELQWTDPSGHQWRDGLCWQAAAVAAHVADGLTEAPEHPLDRSIAVMESLDAARADVASGSA